MVSHNILSRKWNFICKDSFRFIKLNWMCRILHIDNHLWHVRVRFKLIQLNVNMNKIIMENGTSGNVGLSLFSCNLTARHYDKRYYDRKNKIILQLSSLYKLQMNYDRGFGRNVNRNNVFVIWNWIASVSWSCTHSQKMFHWTS